MPTSQTPFLVLTSILIISTIYLILSPVKKFPSGDYNKRYKIAVFLCLVFCIFSFWDTDWFHYLDAFDSLKAGFSGHMEEVYVWIAQHLSPNYYVFRLVVWGVAFLLFLRTIQLLSVSKPLALFFFGTIYIIWFSYARASLAMVMVFYGAAILYGNQKRSIARLTIGIVLIISAFYFHKSAIFAILVFIVALVSVKYPKSFIWMLVLAFPLMILLAKSQLSNFIIMDFESNGDMSEYMAAGQRYMEKNASNRGIGALLQRSLEVLPYYGIAYNSFKELRAEKCGMIPIDIKVFMLMQIVIVLISSIFLFDFGLNTSTIYIRFIRFAAIPTCIVMAYLYEHKLSFKLTRVFIMIATVGTFYAMLYSLYNTLV